MNGRTRFIAAVLTSEMSVGGRYTTTGDSDSSPDDDEDAVMDGGTTNEEEGEGEVMLY
jgi:hypothetical protein